MKFYCPFCKYECLKDEHDGFFHPDGEVWLCSQHVPVLVKHYVSIVYDKRIQWTTKYFHDSIAFWLHKGITYEIRWYWGQNMSDPEPNTFRVVQNYSPILTLPYHPEGLNPDNLDQKLPVWLTFS